MPLIDRRSLLASATAAAVSLPARRARASAPIRIGVLTDMAGAYADDSGKGSIVAAKLAVEDFRKLHADIPVEIISSDFQDKPDIASNIASSWYDRDGVDMIIDVPVSSAALAVAGVAKQRNKLAIFNAGTSALTGKECGPNHAHWAFDTYCLANSTSRAVVAEGGDTWFFIQANYAFGASLAADATTIVQASGGKVLGSVKYPFPETADFSSYLLQAQSSGAKVIGFASAGADTGNLVKQANEFGLTQDGKTKLASLLCFIPQVHSIGLKAAQGLLMSETFYWDLNDATRAFSARYAPQVDGAMPCTIQVGCYSGVFHYLKAVAALGVEAAKASGAATLTKMKEIPTDDIVFGKGRLREDGRKIHDVYLFEVKKPEESTRLWDYFRLVRTTPGEEAFRPLSAGQCPLVRT
ncbi:MAG: ABC transporter substrate-binding protein [Beijerinckiaceae bacterium]